MGHEYDHFDDFLEGDGAIREGGGILESHGLRDYEGIETSVIVEGAGVVLNCRRCNKKRRVVVEWPELVILAENGPGRRAILPQGWRFSENNKDGYVQLNCSSCGSPGYAVHMTPQEAQAHVGAGLKAGLISPQLVQQYQRQVAQMRAGG